MRPRQGKAGWPSRATVYGIGQRIAGRHVHQDEGIEHRPRARAPSDRWIAWIDRSIRRRAAIGCGGPRSPLTRCASPRVEAGDAPVMRLGDLLAGLDAGLDACNRRQRRSSPNQLDDERGRLDVRRAGACSSSSETVQSATRGAMWTFSGSVVARADCAASPICGVVAELASTPGISVDGAHMISQRRRAARTTSKESCGRRLPKCSSGRRSNTT